MLRVKPSVQANEPIGMMVAWVVMRPVNDWQASGVVYHDAAHFDAIANLDGATGRDADVINDLEVPGAALDVEGFVHAVRARSEEKTGRRRDRPHEIDPGRRGAGVRSRQIHRQTHRARRVERQEVCREGRNPEAR